MAKANWLLRTQRQCPELIIGFLAGSTYLAYAAVTVALYQSNLGVTAWVDHFDPVAAALEDRITILVLYRDYLAQQGSMEWLVLTRHLYVFSLMLITAATVYHVLMLYRHLPIFIGQVVGQVAEFRWTKWALSSLSRYSMAALMGTSLVLAFAWFTFVGDMTFTTRTGRAMTSNGHVRLLFWLTFVTLSLSALIPTAINMFLSLFSPRLYNALS